MLIFEYSLDAENAAVVVIGSILLTIVDTPCL